MKVSLRQYGDLLYTYLRPQRGKAMLLAALLLGSIVLRLLVPQILRAFIDSAIQGAAPQALLRTALIFLLVALVNQGLSALATYVGTDVGWRATNLLRADLVHHCLRLDMPFHTGRTPGELIERIDGDATALSNFFSQFVVQLVGSVLLLLGALGVLFYEDWRVGLALALFSGLAATLLNATRDFAVPATIAEREASAQVFGFLEERLAGLDDIRANGGGAYAVRRFHAVQGEFFQKGRRAWQARGSMWLLTIGMFAVGDILAFGMGIYLFQAGVVTLGTVYLFFQYNEILRVPLDQITQHMQELQRAGASVGRIAELRAIPQSIQDGAGPALPAGPLEVRFEGVSFAYGEQERALDDIWLQLEAGSVTGLLGRTGSGKSTLTRLLLRLYDPTEGTIRLGGVETRQARLADLRGRVGIVTQEVQLFHATVRDNLTFFDERIPDERLMGAIEALGLREWFQRLPDGLDTELAAGGAGLSAGEAQLLAFTRVFLQDPGLIILDEPSSRLDPATERLLERAVTRLLHQRTALIIAHRLSTVQRADRIVVMEQGRIVEQGARERLAHDPTSRFARLVQTALESAA